MGAWRAYSFTFDVAARSHAWCSVLHIIAVCIGFVVGAFFKGPTKKVKKTVSQAKIHIHIFMFCKHYHMAKTPKSCL